ncbi:tetratricopeptide repeat protein [Robiginitomaculum antarcticum]|uniref:tetratricopeptide repeat protein n=1 Tax=Robiginitomaculum antarcticum TaxID=437507 RepID=UPI0003664141|nr:hypothetical protein [Robiginitomaculum antarcticum]
MKTLRAKSILALAAPALFVMGIPSYAQVAPPLEFDEIAVVTPHVDPLDFNVRHTACVDSISKDPEIAFEDAMVWKAQGGGFRARHCAALALFATGQSKMAAAQLEQMGSEVGIGTAEARAQYYAQAADFWLVGYDPQASHRAASSGLDLSKSNTQLRIIRARAYAQMDRWDYAETDLTSALAFDPQNISALVYRADARRRLGRFEEALSDAERALDLDIESVEAAVVRGDIREEIRLAALEDQAVAE